MKRRVLLTFVFLCLSAGTNLLVSAQLNKALTNADVLEMISAGLPETTIVLAIQQTASTYDTSPQALIQLKKAGATQKVLDAMLQAKQPQSAVETGTNANTAKPFGGMPGATSGNAAAFGEVTLIDGKNRILMKRTSPDSGMNMGKAMIPGVGLFMKTKVKARFNGNHAQLRTANNLPQFEITLRADENISDVVGIAILQVKSERRELEIARAGVTGASSGLRKENQLPVSFEEIQTYTGSGMKQIKYRIKLVNAASPGEYALAVGATYYDFGIDSSR